MARIQIMTVFTISRFYSSTGGHKEFHFRHKDMCENSLLVAPSLSAGCDPQDDRELMDTHPLTKVLPFLYLGNSKDADDRDGMAGNRITRILNVTTSQQSPSPPATDHRGIVYKRLSVLDNGHANLKQYFEEAFDFIGESDVQILLILFVSRRSVFVPCGCHVESHSNPKFTSIRLNR